MNDTNEPVKVMIVDDHEMILDSLKNEFCPQNGFTVVSSLASAAFAEAECHIKRPALIIMDVCTKGGASGLAAAGKIRERYPEIKIIMTSGFDEITYVPRAKELGAHAFVYKSQSLGYYRETASRVLAGERVFPERKVIPLPKGETPFTAREMEILHMICRQKKIVDIANELFIVEKTVRRHIENMLNKSAFNSMLELVIYVVSNGWINPNFF
ncbi:MAG: response regulator transcription factor [Oscillospiraceae bacterium]|nr:response regulator transcription factor [Oscillospiraceae bacterium]